MTKGLEKGQSEAEHRRTDNAKAKINRSNRHIVIDKGVIRINGQQKKITKRKAMFRKTLYRRLKIELHDPPL
jgi:hypothetical protein